MSASAALKNDDFSFLQDLIYKKTGIVIGDHKREMIFRRLSKRMRDLNIESLDEYCQIIRSNDEKEMNNFINAVTTNLTSFFRENHHFQYIQDTFIPKFLATKERRLRIWSSACSTGEEPYSLAIILKQALGDKLKTLDAKILATDLDTQVIATAKKGYYDHDRLKDLSSNIKSTWFQSTTDSNQFAVHRSLQDLITFNKLNLLGPWPMQGKFDVIFCRNVLIYFDKPTQHTLTERFHTLLKPEGLLILGHSESVLKGNANYESVGKTIYIKRA